MKNRLTAALLFGAIFFIGVDAKAADDDKTADATAWVDGWTVQMKAEMDAMDVSKGMCRTSEIGSLLDVFFLKMKDTAEKNLTEGDLSHLFEADTFVLTVMDKRLSCLMQKFYNLNITYRLSVRSK